MPAPSGRRSVLSRRWTIAALCTLPLGARGQTSTPDFFLRAIYDPYLKADFKGQPYWQVSRFFAPELARAIEADMREAKRRGDGPKATGEVSFDNLGKPTKVTIDLVQTQAGWRIADIKTPSGSLSELYKK